MRGVCREGVADLSSGPEDALHIMNILRPQGVCRDLGNGADRGGALGRAIDDLVVKVGRS